MRPPLRTDTKPKPEAADLPHAGRRAHAPHHRDAAASGGSAISLQIAESLKQLEKGSPPLGGDDDPTILSRNQVFNLEDSVSVQASLKIFVQIFVQRKFSDVRKSTQRTVTNNQRQKLSFASSKHQRRRRSLINVLLFSDVANVLVDRSASLQWWRRRRRLTRRRNSAAASQPQHQDDKTDNEQ
jgi:hypothetical protein